MRTVLIAHRGDAIDGTVLPRWLASWSDLAGVLWIEEPGGAVLRRLKFERRRVGALRLLDVLAFRLYQKAFLSRRDRRWREAALERYGGRWPEPDPPPAECTVASPNSDEALAFLRACDPDVVIARCKVILKKRIFEVPRVGTFVLHPGICPEYRNAHGCFWALARRDLERVGMTLLKIDEGIDTGPVYGHFSYDFDERRETHHMIQYRVVLENLDAIARRLREVAAGEAGSIPTEGRDSGNWGQPWLTRYLAWRRAAKAATP